MNGMCNKNKRKQFEHSAVNFKTGPFLYFIKVYSVSIKTYEICRSINKIGKMSTKEKARKKQQELEWNHFR